MNKILDLGCGNNKRVGAVGIDVNPRSQADVVHDLNDFPYPYPESEFDEIYVNNVLEHLHDVVKVLEELHLIGKSNSLVKITVPYFRSRFAFIDPTHVHFFTVDSLSYFDPSHRLFEQYSCSEARFQINKSVQ